MTEAEWLACTDPQVMLAYLRGRASERRLRLFAVSCCREIWNLFTDERIKQAVEAAERFSDGLMTADGMEKASFEAEDASNEAYHRGNGILCSAGGAAILSAQGVGVPNLHDSMPSIIVNVVEAAEEAGLKTRALMLSEIEKLLRDHLGNPFRPVALDPSWLAWNAGIVPRMAQAIYDDRAFDRLPILADALEEAGCTNADILAHCRSEVPHVRGCWAVDLLLGKT
jgi:hypothetical protein